jgi:hypothetical protein
VKGNQTTLILVVVLLVLLYMRSKASAKSGRARPGGNAPEGELPPPAPELTPAQVKRRVLAPIQVLTVDDPFGKFNF